MINLIRTKLKNLLVLLLTQLETSEKKPISRQIRKKFWQFEITISRTTFFVITILSFFVLLVLELAVTQSNIVLNKLIALCFLTALFLYFLRHYFKHELAEFAEDIESLFLFAVVLIFTLFFIEILRILKWPPYLVPTAMATMLLSILLSSRLAFVSNIAISIIVAIANDFQFSSFLLSFTSGLMGIIGTVNIRHRVDLVRCGLKIVAVNIIVLTTISLFMPNSFLRIDEIFWIGLANGILSTILTLGGLPYLEIVSSRSSNIKLLEIADFNRPLLKRLSLEAPGTFHHSLLVASLSESAAEAIGANSLLCRVCSYYHDIGKLYKPEYFIENQISTVSKHKDLSPTISSLIIISHVKEGMALAQTYNLDKNIIDAIEQHHGVSLIYFFYHRVLEANTKKSSVEQNFRYPGPKPKTKETAILLLADSIEAASRSIEDPAPARLRDMVFKIINNYFIQGQFDDSPITLADLHKIGERFVSTLSGIYHARVEYPEKATENGTQDTGHRT